MYEQENSVLKIVRINPDGIVNSSLRLEIDCSLKITKKTVQTPPDITFEKHIRHWESAAHDKINLNYRRYVDNNPTITVIKVQELDASPLMNHVTHINTAVNDLLGKNHYVFKETKKQQVKGVHLPDNSGISCQNCDTSFPTKYQYQRHQCEFNAEKVVLKPEVGGKDMDKATRLRFECDVCKKSFVSNNNLERHKNCHKNDSNNVCDFCNKSFVSENRLKIHKENHCKKGGDMTKFYRSDVIVWQCDECKQVFASQENGNKHVTKCMLVNSPIKDDEDETSLFKLKSVYEDNNSDSNQINSDTLSLYKDTSPSNNLFKIVTEMLYQCEFCNRTYADISVVLNHQKTHSTDKNYECIFCESHFDSYQLATIHWQKKCNNESNVFYLPKMIYCEHCDRSFKSHEILYNHKNKKRHFTPKIHLKIEEDNHEIRNEKAIVKLIENMISKMDQSLFHAEEPVVKIENRETIQVTGKKKRGRKRKSQKTELKYQKSVYEDGYQYQCERCSMIFRSIPSLISHKETEHAATFCCEQCGQVVHSAKALMIHCRAHQSLKPYVCDQCGRSYSQTSHLWQHMRFHQGIKPFACPHEGCEARYTIRPDLKDHIRKVHTRERPFKCSVCQKCFLTGSVYYQHRLIHTNDRRYGCEVCNKRFFRADALNNHRRIHTDERPYPCPVCGREFRQKGDRNKHVRTQHSV